MKILFDSGLSVMGYDVDSETYCKCLQLVLDTESAKELTDYMAKIKLLEHRNK